jgi:hypothetical protein
MDQTGDEVDLALEPFEAKRCPDLGVKHLEGDLSFVLEIVCEVDRGHTTAPELALEAVSIGEGVPKFVERDWHVGRPR